MHPTNLLFILSDEHNRDCAGCYGHPLVKTPHLDALAARGVRFDAAYANCPICVPSRASLATGRYVHQIGYWDNAFPYEGRVPSWGHRLIEEGHRVEAIGKLHYRSETDEDGFSRKILPLNVVDGVGDVMGAIRDDQFPRRPGMGEGVRNAGPGASSYLDYDLEIAVQTCQWLRDAAKRRQRDEDEKPWVLLCSFVCPHPPYIAPPDHYEMYPLNQIPLPIQNRPHEQPQHPALVQLRRAMTYDQPFSEEEVRRLSAAYFGMCTYLDQQIGKVLKALDETGLSENTRVIYSSDHGESLGCRGIWGKFTMYEESVAAPMIVAGPNVPQGEVVNSAVSLVDCYPTILRAVGVEASTEDSQLPGRSLWSVIRDQPVDRIAFSEYHAVASKGASYMLREGRFKYVYYVGHPPQLFDLQADPQEQSDLAGDSQYGELLQDFEQKLRRMLDPEEVDDRAKADQQALIQRHGGRQAVLQRGTFINSPTPLEKAKFVSG